MDELSKRLSEILNDPQSMNKVKEMAESILKNEPEPEPEPPTNPLGGILDSGELLQVMSLVSKLQTQSDDPRTSLLLALKPHLSEAKRDKVDTAVKILRLLDLLPLIKETGILGKLL